MIIHAHAWQSLRRTFPTRKSEWAMGVATVCFWLVFALNVDLFKDNPGYASLAEVAPQVMWSWLCFIVGVGRCAALYINGAHWRSPHARAAFAFLNCFLWYKLSVGLAENAGLGMIFAGTFFIMDVLNFKQACIEAAISEGLKHVERRNTARHTH